MTSKEDVIALITGDIAERVAAMTPVITAISALEQAIAAAQIEQALAGTATVGRVLAALMSEGASRSPALTVHLAHEPTKQIERTLSTLASLYRQLPVVAADLGVAIGNATGLDAKLQALADAIGDQP